MKKIKKVKSIKSGFSIYGFERTVYAVIACLSVCVCHQSMSY